MVSLAQLTFAVREIIYLSWNFGVEFMEAELWSIEWIMEDYNNFKII